MRLSQYYLKSSNSSKKLITYFEFSFMILTFSNNFPFNLLILIENGISPKVNLLENISSKLISNSLFIKLILSIKI